MFKKIVLVVLLMSFTTVVFARAFWQNNRDITRTMSDGQFYGGCMIKLSIELPDDCNINGSQTNWVSLDCNNKYYKNGPQHYATALMAMSANMKVSVFIKDTTIKHSGYCVARRIDVVK